MELSKSLESIVFNLNEKNFETSVQETINLFVDRLPYTFNYLVSRLIYSAFVSQSNNENIYIKYLLTLKEKEDEKDKNKSGTEANLVQIFHEYLLRIEKQESYFLLEKMIEEEIIEPSSVKNMNTLYFSQYKTKEEFNKLWNKFSRPQFFEEFISALDELSKDDWKLHMQYVKEGVNPLEIAKVLRNDDLEKFQEISSHNEFDFNQIIESSLYERCSFVNTKNVSLIDYCAFFGSIKCFKYLLLNNSNIKNTSKYAIAGGNLEIIHLCEQNNLSFTEAYETAIEFHRNEIFHYLYENKIGKFSSSNSSSFTKSNSDIENQDNYNLSEKNLIFLGKKCIEFNNYEIFSFLEKEGMKINNEIIEEIASKGNTFIIESDIGSQQIPKTILPYSVKTGNIEIVKLLLDKEGIDVNAKTYYGEGETALHIAVRNNNIEIVKLLLDKEGIDVNAKTRGGEIGYYEKGETALHIAVRNNNIEIVKLLLDKGIDVNAKTYGGKKGETSLHIAVRNNNIEIVKLLLDKGIDVNAKTVGGYYETALHIAVKNNNIEIVKLLLEGIDVNAKTVGYGGYYETALHIAVKNNNIEIVKLLLDKGIDVNEKTRGETSLHIAVRNNNIEIIKLLLDKGIDVNAITRGETAFKIAKRLGFREIKQLLSEKGAI